MLRGMLADVDSSCPLFPLILRPFSLSHSVSKGQCVPHHRRARQAPIPVGVGSASRGGLESALVTTHRHDVERPAGLRLVPPWLAYRPTLGTVYGVLRTSAPQSCQSCQARNNGTIGTTEARIRSAARPQYRRPHDPSHSRPAPSRELHAGCGLPVWRNGCLVRIASPHPWHSERTSGAGCLRPPGALTVGQTVGRELETACDAVCYL